MANQNNLTTAIKYKHVLLQFDWHDPQFPSFLFTVGQQHVTTGPAAQVHDRAGQTTDSTVQGRRSPAGQSPDGERETRGEAVTGKVLPILLQLLAKYCSTCCNFWRSNTTPSFLQLLAKYCNIWYSYWVIIAMLVTFIDQVWQYLLQFLAK